MVFKNVGVFCKPKSSIGQQVLSELTAWLRRRGCQVLMDGDSAGLIGETSAHDKSEIPGLSQLIVVLGGDGTLLRVVQLSHACDVPILAVNLGSLGFLTEISLPELYPTLEAVLSGNFTAEQRMLLNACLWRDGEKVEEHTVLNDVAIGKGALARIVNLEVNVNGRQMTSYRADGLIIATPTGSTAYSLSAGGPIIHPSMHALVLSPICPFNLTNRSIVIPGNSQIEVRLATENEDVAITLDGQTGWKMHMGDTLEVKKARNAVKLVQNPGKNYYQILRQKLHWGRPAHDQGGGAGDNPHIT